MNKKLIYGVVINNKFYSNTMFVDIIIEDGLYSIDVASDDYLNTIEPADLIEFDKYVKSCDKMRYMYGLSFLDGFIPYNMIQWNIPIKLKNPIFNDWEVVKVLHISHRNIFYYMDTIFNSVSSQLFELKDYFISNSNILKLKNITPEMKMLYTFHQFEKIKYDEELKKLEEISFKKTFGGRLKSIIESVGGILKEYKKLSRGYQVIWELSNEIYDTWIDDNFSVIEAGVCIGGQDKDHSMRSIVNVIKTGMNEGINIYKTRRYYD